MGLEEKKATGSPDSLRLRLSLVTAQLRKLLCPAVLHLLSGQRNWSGYLSLGSGLCLTPPTRRHHRQAEDTGQPTAVPWALEAELRFDCFFTKNWTKIITPISQMEKWRQRTVH